MSTTATTTLKRELLDLEKAYWEALKSEDAATLARLTADEFTMAMGEGISSTGRDDFVEMMTRGDMRLKSYRLDDGNATFRELGPGVALLAYKGSSEFQREGQDRPEKADYFYSTTWIRSGNTWRAAAGSASRAEPAE
jgi:hypothetical protein